MHERPKSAPLPRSCAHRRDGSGGPLGKKDEMGCIVAARQTGSARPERVSRKLSVDEPPHRDFRA